MEVKQLDLAMLDEAILLMKTTFALPPWNETWTDARAKARLLEFLHAPKGLNYVCFDHEKMVGVLCSHLFTFHFGVELMIDDFFIHPEYQQQGIGKKMLAHLIKESRPHHVVSLVLNTEKGSPAEQFYLAQGFQQQDSTIFMYLNLPLIQNEESP